MIGKLESVDLRLLWKHEEHDFSVWLEKNIDYLNESLGITLSPVQREKKVGPFEVDLVAEDANGDLVIIENQLNPTNHDHEC
jgi:RecB family endonuclease NucS